MEEIWCTKILFIDKYTVVATTKVIVQYGDSIKNGNKHTSFTIAMWDNGNRSSAERQADWLEAKEGI